MMKKFFLFAFLFLLASPCVAQKYSYLTVEPPYKYEERTYKYYDSEKWIRYPLPDEDESMYGPSLEGWDKLEEHDFENMKLPKYTAFWGDMPGTRFAKTADYKSGVFSRIQILEGNYSNCVFSNFMFFNLFYPDSIDGANFSDAYFENSAFPFVMSAEQFKSTRNYKIGFYRRMIIGLVFEVEMDFSRAYFEDCLLCFRTKIRKRNSEGHWVEREIHSEPAKFTDAKFINCDLTEVENLTLEQVKSTWNYKTGHMDLSQWPEHILKALEAEKGGNTP
ncbi:MAG: hypothetical protein Q4C70_04240 [Planctomycetia bacterium]|nr:hypothetical protein [Planctomycetia bacterium]